MYKVAEISSTLNIYFSKMQHTHEYSSNIDLRCHINKKLKGTVFLQSE